MLILEVGEPKTGKTVSACTFPKPMCYIDIDDGFLSARTAKNKDGSQVVQDLDKIEVVPFFNKEYFDLNFKTAESADFKMSRAPEHTKNSAELMGKYNAVVKELFDTQKYNGKGPFQTLVVDSLTTMYRIWKDTILFTNKLPALRISDYGTLEGIMFRQFIPTLKSLNEKIPWIILIDHEDMDKDELSGAVQEFPIGPSRAMGKMLSEAFDEIWRQRVENGEYVWRTRAHGRFSSAGSRNSLPDPLKPATFQELSKHLKGG